MKPWRRSHFYCVAHRTWSANLFVQVFKMIQTFPLRFLWRLSHSRRSATDFSPQAWADRDSRHVRRFLAQMRLLTLVPLKHRFLRFLKAVRSNGKLLSIKLLFLKKSLSPTTSNDSILERKSNTWAKSCSMLSCSNGDRGSWIFWQIAWSCIKIKINKHCHNKYFERKILYLKGVHGYRFPSH